MQRCIEQDGNNIARTENVRVTNRENVAREMAYRLGESLSALVRATADGANSVDSSVLTQLAASSTTSFTTLSLTYIRNAVQSLAGRSVRPFDEASKNFAGVIHQIGGCKILSD